jgi:hypothetical protein
MSPVYAEATISAVVIHAIFQKFLGANSGIISEKDYCSAMCNFIVVTHVSKISCVDILKVNSLVSPFSKRAIMLKDSCSKFTSISKGTVAKSMMPF